MCRRLPRCTKRAWEPYQRHYLAINGQHSAVYPGVDRGPARLAARGPAAGLPDQQARRFARAAAGRPRAWRRFFEVVFGGDAFERKKPDPLPLLKTCEALGTRRARTLMVGDSSNDAAAARAAGCPVVLVTYGYNHGEPVRGGGRRRLRRLAGRAGRLAGALSSGRLAQQRFLQLPVGRRRAQPDAQQRVEELGLLERLALLARP